MVTILTGVRSGELVKIKLSDIQLRVETSFSDLGEEIDYYYYQVKIWNEKIDSEKLVLVPVELIDAIKAYYKSEIWLFEIYSKNPKKVRHVSQRIYQEWMDKFCQEYPEFDVWPHLLRHVADTMYWDRFKDAIVVSRILGNTPATVMNVYAHPARDTYAELSTAENAISKYLIKIPAFSDVRTLEPSEVRVK